MDKTNFANIDCTTTLRGIAILIIIVGHVGVSGFDCRYFNPFGGIGVAMFLFLSGYGLTESFKKKGISHFWSKKVFRIAIPYLLWIPLYHIVVRISPLGSPYHIETIPRYWFIEYLLIMYVAFYVTIRVRKQYMISLLALMGFVFFFTLNNLRAEQSFSFLGGVLFSEYKLCFSILNRKKLFTISLTFLAIGITALLIKQLPSIRLYDFESMPFKICNLFLKLPLAIFFIFLFLSVLPNGNKWISKIGNISYELYLVHVSFFMGIRYSYINLTLFIIQTFILAYILNTLTKQVNKIKKAYEK